MHSRLRVVMAELPPGVIPVSANEFDRLYPRYELEAKPGQTFQQWLKADRRKAARKRIKTGANSIEESQR